MTPKKAMAMNTALSISVEIELLINT